MTELAPGISSSVAMTNNEGTRTWLAHNDRLIWLRRIAADPGDPVLPARPVSASVLHEPAKRGQGREGRRVRELVRCDDWRRSLAGSRHRTQPRACIDAGHGFENSTGGICRRRRIAAGGDLGDDGGDALVEGSCHQDARATLAVAPHGQLRRIDLVQRGDEVDGVAVADDLQPVVDLLARLAVAAAEVAMVVQQDGHPGVAERCRVLVGHHAVRGGREAVGHDHDRRPTRASRRQEQPPAERGALRRELHEALHLHPRFSGSHRTLTIRQRSSNRAMCRKST